MEKLVANTRFLNAFDGKIYDKGDYFTVKSEADKKYFLDHKIGSEIKEQKKENKKR